MIKRTLQEIADDLRVQQRQDKGECATEGSKVNDNLKLNTNTGVALPTQTRSSSSLIPIMVGIITALSVGVFATGCYWMGYNKGYAEARAITVAATEAAR